MPLLYVYLLYRVRDKLVPKANNADLAMQIRDNDDALASVKFLFQDYLCEKWYFEVVDMYRRIIFLGVIPLMGSDGAGRAYAGAALGLLSCVYFRESVPFRIPFTNFLAVVSQYVILLAFMAALLVATDSLDALGISDFALGSIMSATNITVVLIAVFIGYQQYTKMQAQLRAKILAKTIKLEWATGFSANKFNTTFQYVTERSVASSHILCFYYTSLAEAQHIIENGRIPALKLDVDGFGGGGVLLSMKGPQEIQKGDPALALMGKVSASRREYFPVDSNKAEEGAEGSAAVAMSREVVFVLNIPRSTLFPFPKQALKPESTLMQNQEQASIEAVIEHLRIIPGDLLQALGNYAPPAAPLSDFKKAELSKTIAKKRMEQANTPVTEAVLVSGQFGLYVDDEDHLLEKEELEALERSRPAVLSLPSSAVVRAYQLVSDQQCEGPRLRLGDYLRSFQAVDADLPEPSPESLKAYLSKLSQKDKKKKLLEIKAAANERERIRKHELLKNSKSPTRRLLKKAASELMGSDIDESSPNEDAAPLPLRRAVHVVQPATCAEYLTAMAAVRRACEEEGTVPLYHYTMLEVAPFILGGGFRMSTQGQGDGGVYFSTLGPSSYNLGADDYEKNIIVDCFGKERLEEYRGKHKLDLLFVYGVNPKCVEQAPGGRENAKMVPKALFNDFAEPMKDGNYFLRPDHIKAAFLLDGTSGLPKGLAEVVEGMAQEKDNDAKVQATLKASEEAMKGNALSAQAVKALGFGKRVTVLLGKIREQDDDGEEEKEEEEEEEEEEENDEENDDGEERNANTDEAESTVGTQLTKLDEEEEEEKGESVESKLMTSMALNFFRNEDPEEEHAEEWSKWLAIKEEERSQSLSSSTARRLLGNEDLGDHMNVFSDEKSDSSDDGSSSNTVRLIGGSDDGSIGSGCAGMFSTSTVGKRFLEEKGGGSLQAISSLDVSSDSTVVAEGQGSTADESDGRDANSDEIHSSSSSQGNSGAFSLDGGDGDNEDDGDHSTGRTVTSVLEAAGFEGKSWKRHADAFAMNGVGVEALFDESSPASDLLLYDLGLTKAEVERLRKFLNHCFSPDTAETSWRRRASLDLPPTARS